MGIKAVESFIEDGVMRIILSRPQRLNAMNALMHEQLRDALDMAESNRSVRAILLTGAGRAFCAGQDLSERRVGAHETIDLGESLDRLYNPLVRRLTSMPVPIVCAMNGVAAGAGASIALACDLVLAARSARLIQSFAALGLIPDSGGSWVLPRLAGQARALGLALLGDPIDAETAADWGLIWRAVDDDSLMEEASALSSRLAMAPTAGLAATKRLIRTSCSRDLNTTLDLERDEMRRLGATEDYREGVAAFLEKRTPNFPGK